MNPLVVAAAGGITLIRLHGPAGNEIDINPHRVSSIRETHKHSIYYTEKIKCLVTMSNGKFIGVRQDCAEVRDLLLHPHGVVK